jgi:transposase
MVCIGRSPCLGTTASLSLRRGPATNVKTDRRNATTLAALFRSRELTPVWVPDDAHEAMRDLCRARQAAMEGLRRARQQILSFLLRHGRSYSAGNHWTRKHRLWLAAQRFDRPARQIAFEELVQAVEEAKARRDRLATQILKRNESLPQPIKDIAWKAQVRQCARQPESQPTSSMSP